MLFHLHHVIKLCPQAVFGEPAEDIHTTHWLRLGDGTRVSAICDWWNPLPVVFCPFILLMSWSYWQFDFLNTYSVKCSSKLVLIGAGSWSCMCVRSSGLQLQPLWSACWQRLLSYCHQLLSVWIGSNFSIIVSDTSMDRSPIRPVVELMVPGWKIITYHPTLTLIKPIKLFCEGSSVTLPLYHVWWTVEMREIPM